SPGDCVRPGSWPHSITMTVHFKPSKVHFKHERFRSPVAVRRARSAQWRSQRRRKTMRIIRYEDAAGRVHHAALQPDGSARRIEGDLYDQPRVTDETVEVTRLRAPIQPTALFCIGLNYRKHAEETGKTAP